MDIITLSSYKYMFLFYFIDKSDMVRHPSLEITFTLVWSALDELYVSADQFWLEHNKPFLDGVIQLGDDIVMATKPTIESLYIPGTNELTGFGREYYYLLEKGYTFDSIKNIMIMK